MNKKQLRISLVVLGLFAIAVICIGLFSGTGGNKTDVAYDAELVKQLESLGDMDLASITNFKDGLYEVDTHINNDDINITEVDKDKNTLVLYGNTVDNTPYICRAKIKTEYDKAKTYEVSMVTVLSDKEYTSVNNIIEDLKSGELLGQNVTVNSNKLLVKITDDCTVIVNDTVMKKKEIKKLTDDERKKKEEELQKEIDARVKEAEEINGDNILDVVDIPDLENDTIVEDGGVTIE